MDFFLTLSITSIRRFPIRLYLYPSRYLLRLIILIAQDSFVALLFPSDSSSLSYHLSFFTERAISFISLYLLWVTPIRKIARDPGILTCPDLSRLSSLDERASDYALFMHSGSDFLIYVIMRFYGRNLRFRPYWVMCFHALCLLSAQSALNPNLAAGRSHGSGFLSWTLAKHKTQI